MPKFALFYVFYRFVLRIYSISVDQRICIGFIIMEDAYVTVCVATIRVAKTNVLNTLCNRPSETLPSGLIIQPTH